MNTRTKVEIIVAVFITVLAIIPNVVMASDYTYENFTYTRWENTPGVTEIEITGVIDKNITEINNIPEKIDGIDVKFIGYEAFKNCTSLESVKIPSNINSIGGHAFSGCTNLTNITLSESITTISDELFYGCKNLVNINIPKSVTKIEGSAFSGCTSLSNITIPDGVTSIPFGTFYQCASLTNIKIPDNVTNIGDAAFRECPNLVSVELSDNVTSIGNEAFLDCINLKNINISRNLISIGNGAFYGCQHLTNIQLPNTLISIGEYVFSDCKSLERLELSNSLISISDYAFGGCSSLTNVEIPDSIATLGESAFNGCANLVSIKLPNNITKIGDMAFCGCEKLTIMEIPNSVETIGYHSFDDCTNLTLIAETGSYGETYARNHRIRYYNDYNVENCTIDNLQSQIYTGSEIMPNIAVKFGSILLIEETDYTLNYLNNIDVGTATIEITGMGIYTGKKIITFEIELKNLLQIEKTIDTSNKIYTGYEITTTVLLQDDDVTLLEGTDYTVEYSDNKNAGTATITITGIGRSTGEIIRTFEIEKKDISQLEIAEIPDEIYTGRFIYPNITIKNRENTLIEGIDYEIKLLINEYTNNFLNIYAGNASVLIVGRGNYLGSKYISFKILPKDISEVETSEVPSEILFSGDEFKPDVIVKDNANQLFEGKDYSINYSNNRNVGTAIITITGKGNYTGIKTITFEILPINMSEVKISEIPNQIYSGNEIIPNMTVRGIYNSILEEGKDYTVTYLENKNAGTATIEITGKGIYTGTRTINFVITKAVYDMSSVKFENATVVYDGKEHSIEASGLPEGVTVSYENNGKINAGEYEVVAKFVGDTANYELIPNMKAKLIIKPINLTKVTISVNTSNKTYTGTNINTAITLKDGNKELKEGMDYSVSYVNNNNTGKVTTTITGKGIYAGTITRTFLIIPSQVTNLKAKSQKEKEITLQWSKNGGNVTGYKLYQYNSKTKKWNYIGKTTNNNYTIKKLTVGTTYKFKVKAYKKIDKKYYEGKQAELSATTQPSKTKINKLTTKNKKVIIKWNKVSNATGYEIYMSKNKNKGYSKIKNITKKSTVKYTKKKLKKNKKYYFKVRTYRIVNGMKLYSSYSNIKSIKVKK